MRIGSSVLLKGGMSIQSYNWTTHRPLGCLNGVMESLDEYRCDEIAIIRPVRADDPEALKRDINQLRQLSSTTPISFGGGIRNSHHLSLVRELPVERIIFSSAFMLADRSVIDRAVSLFGCQAVQCLLPFRMSGHELEFFVSSESRFIPYKQVPFQLIDECADEVILYDTDAEGESDGFQFGILDKVPFSNSKIVICGGVGPKTVELASLKYVAAVLIDNKVLHREYSLKDYKRYDQSM